MRAKLTSLLLSLCLVFTLTDITAAAAAEKPIQLIVNGKRIEGANPILRSGVMYAPYRLLFEAVGFKVGYDAQTKVMSGTLGESKLSFSAGSYLLEFDGKLHYLDGPIPVINGQTYLPVRTVGELAGYSVYYDKPSSTLRMTYYGLGQEGAIQALMTNYYGSFSPKYLTSDNMELAYYNLSYDYEANQRVSEVPTRQFKADITKRKWMSFDEAVIWVTYTNITDVLEVESKCTLHIRKENGQWKIARTNWYFYQTELPANADQLAATILTNQKDKQQAVLDDLHAYYEALNTEDYERVLEYTSPKLIQEWNDEVVGDMTWEEMHEGLFDLTETRYKLSGERVLFLGEKEAVIHATMDWSDTTEGIAEGDYVFDVLITLDYSNGHWTYYEDISLDDDYDDSGIFATQ
ncbi:ketosteroid isomerase-like protein [Paenibacillus phyllosphaerae]|uniref:Ketosteroid isomerase-like protein n=1 Tax=Paenibacillus phyllosphaerae TaxID=274593 RepID=A0A7W5B1S3_9BACL|nr:copper amine oxidase N-terminal domain-containing protein [Paenibacillus phyllosphaerae]MBB3112864.1 ketosteroid isomerase-like protein [Paenibacillus phyllosphaerae]